MEKSGIACGVEPFDPAKARSALSKVAMQRPVSINNVRSLVEEMRNGRWTINNDCISFDEDGNLLNGQHRMHAVIEFGGEINFNVIRGLDTSSFVTMDQGRKRTGSDTLASIGFSNSVPIAATCRILMSIRDSDGPTRNLTNKKDLVSFADKHAVFLEESVKLAAKSKKYTNTPSLASVVFQALHLNEVKATEFSENLASGLGESLNDPVVRLRNKLLDNRNRKDFYSRPETIIPIMIVAWEAFREGRELNKISPTGRFLVKGFHKELL